MSLKHQTWMILGNTNIGLRLIDCYFRWHKSDIGVVKKTTEIVIEGYPRSANTSAVAAFRIAQDCPVKVAHHVHGAAQIKRASRFKIPCIVLIRDPVDAAVSLCIRNRKISMQQAINNYIYFYKCAAQYRTDFVLAEFSTVLYKFDEVIEIVNKKFHKRFKLLGQPIATSDEVRCEVENMDKNDNNIGTANDLTVALPTSAKRSLKDKLQLMIEKDLRLKKNISAAYMMKERITN